MSGLRLKNGIYGIIFTVLMGLLTACGEESDGGGGGFESITSSGMAEFMVEDLADGVIIGNLLAALPNGTYSNEVVYGLSGTATVDGKYIYNGSISCGSSCVRSETDADIAILFNQYRVMSAGNTEAVVNGWVWYTNTRWSQQSGYSYSSGGSVTVGSYVDNSVTYQVSDIDTGTFAYRDTILEFVASGSFASNLSGRLIAGNGTEYTF